MSPALIAAFVAILCALVAVFTSVYAATQAKKRRRP